MKEKIYESPGYDRAVRPNLHTQGEEGVEVKTFILWAEPDERFNQ